MELAVKKSADKTPTIITISGEIDHFNVEPFSTAVKEAFAESRDLVIDLSGSTYIDSAGVNIIFMAAKLARDRQGHVKIIAKTKEVKRIFEIAGVDKLNNVEVYEELKSALP